MSLVLALLLSLAPPVMDPAHQDLHDLAMQAYDAGRFAEAATRFEALAAVDPRPSLHFEAGQMRFASGHHAHAWRHFQAYLAADLGADDRELGESRLAQAAARTRVVEVRLAPADVAATIVAHRIGDVPELQRPDLATSSVAGVAALRLDPGPWELRVDVPGYRPLRQRLDVGDAATPVMLVLEPQPTPAALPPVADPARVDDDARRRRRWTVAGAVLVPLGAAVGAGFFGVLHSHGRTRSEFYRLDLTCNDRAALDDLRVRSRQETAALVTLGVAAGALLTAGTALLVRGRATTDRPRLTVDFTHHHAGLTLLGNF